MASHAPITGAPTRAPAFKLNGCTISEDLDVCLEHAHAVLCCLEIACRDSGDGPLNPNIIAAAADAAQSMIFNAAAALRAEREGR